jgi:hypothetical protein
VYTGLLALALNIVVATVLQLVLPKGKVTGAEPLPSA